MSNDKKHNIKISILDELSDGQWHPFNKIFQAMKERTPNVVPDHMLKNILSDRLPELVDESRIISGANNSYRMKHEQLLYWRAQSKNPIIHDKRHTPRYFGGILEDDGWAAAPLKPFNLIHFRADLSLTREKVSEVTGVRMSRIQVEDELYRILIEPGEEVLPLLLQFKKEHAEYEIQSMRQESNLRRRELSDLPSRFLDEAIKYYGQFAKVFLRSRMSSIVKHLPDPDDIQQQIYLWVLDAIQRYDAETSIPFAAYLSTSLSKWVFNLNRKSYGRSVADAELKHSRAIASFVSENGREPSPDELADILGEDVNTVRKETNVINTVFHLRNIATITPETGDIPIASHERVDEVIEENKQVQYLSVIITQIMADNVRNGGDLVGFLALYYTTWGKDKQTKQIKHWLRGAKIQENMHSLLETVRATIKNNKKDDISWD